AWPWLRGIPRPARSRLLTGPLLHLEELLDVGLRQPRRGTRKPCLHDHLREVLDAYPLQAHEHGRIAVEVRSGEELTRLAGEQHLLRREVLHSGAQNRALRSRGAKRLDFPWSQGTLPHEQLLPHAPLAAIAGNPFARLRHCQRDSAHVIPAGHARSHPTRAPLPPPEKEPPPLAGPT